MRIHCGSRRIAEGNDFVLVVETHAHGLVGGQTSTAVGSAGNNVVVARLESGSTQGLGVGSLVGNLPAGNVHGNVAVVEQLHKFTIAVL